MKREVQKEVKRKWRRGARIRKVVTRVTTISVLSILFVLLLLSVQILAQEIPGCRNKDTCKNIDEVWITALGNIIRGSAMLWDPQSGNGNWRPFSEVYVDSRVAQTGAGLISNTLLPKVCFPITQDSFDRNSNNFGSPRAVTQKDGNVLEGRRCHVGVDLYTHTPGSRSDARNIVAIDDGIVLNIIGNENKGWTTCDSPHNWGLKREQLREGNVAAILIYHPNLVVNGHRGVTINYGEIDISQTDKISVEKGQDIVKGQFIGRAAYCGMLHVEAYKGQQTNNLNWAPTSPQTVSNANECISSVTRDDRILDPTDFLNSIRTNNCNPLVSRAQLSPEQRATTIVAGGKSLDSCTVAPGVIDIQTENPSLLQTRELWDTALRGKGVSGTTYISKSRFNGPTDGENEHRLDTGRAHIIFIPCTTDLERPVEIIYSFHGLTGFKNEFSKRIAPQLKTMMASQRNFVVVLPELPWSMGTHSSLNECQNNGRCVGSRQKSFVWQGADGNFPQFHSQVLQELQRFGVTNYAGITLRGHSAGGAAIYAVAPIMKEIGVTRIILSDADYFGTAQKVYSDYIKYDATVEMTMLVQHPNRTYELGSGSTGSQAHQPTAAAINFLIKNGGDATSSWQHNLCNADTVPKANDVKKDCLSTTSLPHGFVPNDLNQPFTLPGTKIRYVPRQKSHDDIAKESLAWVNSAVTFSGAVTSTSTSIVADSPRRCTYTDSSIDKNKTTVHVNKLYSELTPIEKHSTGCTLCIEDQVQVSINGQTTSICKIFAKQIQGALNQMDTNGFVVESLVGYRPGRTRDKGKTFSEHAYGAALDINSANNGLYNCDYTHSDCKQSYGGVYKPRIPGAIVKDGPAYIAMTQGGVNWKWGGEWTTGQKDYMHFSTKQNT